MAQSMVNFRMDTDLKKSMEIICDDMGMSLTTAFTIFAKKLIKVGGIPFEVKADPFYSESNMRYLEESIAQMDKGKFVVKTMEELETMLDE